MGISSKHKSRGKKPNRISQKVINFLYPNKPNGLSHPYHLDEPTFILGASGVFFPILFHFSMNFMQANKTPPDGTPRFAIRGYSVCLCPKKKGHQAYMGFKQNLTDIDHGNNMFEIRAISIGSWNYQELIYLISTHPGLDEHIISNHEKPCYSICE